MHTDLFIETKIKVLFELFKVSSVADGIKIFIGEGKVEMDTRIEHKAFAVAALEILAVGGFFSGFSRELGNGYFRLGGYAGRVAVHPQAFAHGIQLFADFSVKTLKLFYNLPHAWTDACDNLNLVFTEISGY